MTIFIASFTSVGHSTITATITIIITTHICFVTGLCAIRRSVYTFWSSCQLPLRFVRHGRLLTQTLCSLATRYVLLNKYYLLVYFRQLIFLRLVPRNGDSDWLWVSFSLGRKGYRLIWELGWPSYSLIVSIPFKALRYAPGNDCSLTYVDQLPYLRSVINTRSPSAFMMYCCSLRSLVFDQSFLRTEPVNPSLEGAN